MRILTAESMREVDRHAIDVLGVPSLVLMENAAIGVVDAIGEVFADAHRVIILCGPGNNGGDGLAIGRHLYVRGYETEIVLLTGGRELAGDPAAQLNICNAIGMEVEEIASDEDLRSLEKGLYDADLVVDALFGTGLGRPLTGRYEQVITLLNEIPTPVCAVDLPSGLNGSSGEDFGPHVLADLTVTFLAPKVAHIFPPASEAVGELIVADLGIPGELAARASDDLELLTAEELSLQLLERETSSHKGDFGHVLVIAGSIGKVGAAILAAQGAVRSGAGLVTAAVPRAIVGEVDGGSIESMTVPLSEEVNGGLAPSAVEECLKASEGKNAVAIGPGIGSEGDTPEVVRKIVLSLELPVIIDADGINAFAGSSELLAKRAGQTILTPHPGELSRLLGVPVSEILEDRRGSVQRAADEAQAIVVLKGSLSLIAAPGGSIAVNPTGNPGMATGGTGDVLTGILLGFIGCGYEPLVATELAVFLHGLSGDIAARRRGYEALTATDLLDSLAQAITELGAL